MGFYFLNEMIRRPETRDSLHEVFDAPIKITQSTWEHFDEPRRLSKAFVFDDVGQQRFFITELMKAIDIRQHNVKLIIEVDTVQVETRTSMIDDITEIDLQIARTADSIYDDSQFILEVE